ncbi:chorismate mutase [Phreatobacter sp.]|uniref:chorismate mutase n=1 Tax=Phreatobacter sp. TaxID=1966341 RepID=UPI003F7245F6
MTQPSLSDLRAEIDRIDDAMHDLLMERGRIIEQLIAVKQTAETGSAFRPAREADVVRRLLGRHTGRLPAELVVQIWRQIISTFTYIQAPHSIHVLMGPEQENAREFARFHFGFGVPLVRHSSPASVMDAILRDRGDLGLIGLGPAREAWWERLGRDGQPVAMAAAPAVTPAGLARLPQALVIGHPSIDTAGLDTQLVAAVLTGVSEGHDGAILASSGEGGRHHVLVWGEREADAVAIAAGIAGSVAVEEARTVGYTARPIAA